jgi:hypothetical protein
MRHLELENDGQRQDKNPGVGDQVGDVSEVGQCH